jgi:hypothetical protein
LASWDSISPINHLGSDRIADLIFLPYISNRNNVLMWADFKNNQSRQQYAHEHLLQYRRQYIENRQDEFGVAPVPVHESPLVSDLNTTTHGDNPVEHYIPHSAGSGFRPRTKNDIFNWRHYLL